MPDGIPEVVGSTPPVIMLGFTLVLSLTDTDTTSELVTSALSTTGGSIHGRESTLVVTPRPGLEGPVDVTMGRM